MSPAIVIEEESLGIDDAKSVEDFLSADMRMNPAAIQIIHLNKTLFTITPVIDKTKMTANGNGALTQHKDERQMPTASAAKAENAGSASIEGLLSEICSAAFIIV